MTFHPTIHSNFFHRRVPLWFFVFSAAVISIAAVAISRKFMTASVVALVRTPAAVASFASCNVHQQRTKNSHFTNRLLFSDTEGESDKFRELKTNLENLIERQKRDGYIASASVFFKLCDDVDWFSVNPNEGFRTASIMKIAALITMLKMADNNPAVLDKVYDYTYHDSRIPKQAFGGPSIVPGNRYKMRDLLYYMIVYSDNYAANAVNGKVDMNLYKKLFTDLGVEGFDFENTYRKMTAAEVAKFFRVLYNSSYLTENSSEYALSLLSQSTFKDGLLKELPPGVTVAHKFGEGGGLEENQLSEAGIVYAGNKPYLVVVMTRGNRTSDLSKSIGEISRQVYDYINLRAVN